MDKKGSTLFIVIVAVFVVGFLCLLFWKKNVSAPQPTAAIEQKVESCSKRAYNGKVTIRGWQENNADEGLIRVAPDDVNKLPAGHGKQVVKLVDGSPEMIKKLKNASEKKPQEITIQGFFDPCEEPVLVSIARGEEMFKKYLKG